MAWSSAFDCSGGVPAVAAVDFSDCGVPIVGESVPPMCGDFLVSFTASLECARLSCLDCESNGRCIDTRV